MLFIMSVFKRNIQIQICQKLLHLIAYLLVISVTSCGKLMNSGGRLNDVLLKLKLIQIRKFIVLIVLANC